MAISRQEIVPADELYRRLARDHITPADGTVNKSTFMRNRPDNPKRKEPDPDVSVYLARMAKPRQCLRLAKKPWQGIGALEASFPAGLGLCVTHTPEEDPDNLAHSSIRGNVGERARENCFRLAEEMSQRILIYPEGSTVQAGWIPPDEAILGE